MVEDAIEVRRAGRKSAHGGWIGRGLGKGKDRNQNLVTVNSEGNRWDRSVWEGHGEGSAGRP